MTTMTRRAQPLALRGLALVAAGTLGLGLAPSASSATPTGTAASQLVTVDSGPVDVATGSVSGDALAVRVRDTGEVTGGTPGRDPAGVILRARPSTQVVLPDDSHLAAVGLAGRQVWLLSGRASGDGLQPCGTPQPCPGRRSPFPTRP